MSINSERKSGKGAEGNGEGWNWNRRALIKSERLNMLVILKATFCGNSCLEEKRKQDVQNTTREIQQTHTASSDKSIYLAASSVIAATTRSNRGNEPEDLEDEDDKEGEEEGELDDPRTDARRKSDNNLVAASTRSWLC